LQQQYDVHTDQSMYIVLYTNKLKISCRSINNPIICT